MKKVSIYQLVGIVFFISAILLSCDKEECDIGNIPPEIENQSFNIDENSPNGTLIGAIESSDINDNQTLSYSIIKGNDAEVFSIDSLTGEITVKDQDQIDYELNPQFELIVEVRVNGKVSCKSSALVSINITDVNEIPTEGLVAYYPLNGNAIDESGNNHNGTLFGTTSTSDKMGDLDMAILFDGTNDYITLPQDFDYAERTISFWFNAVNIPEWNYDIDPDNSLRIIYTSDHPNIENGLTKMWVTKINGVPKLSFHNGGADVVLDNSFTINEMEWYFAAITITTTSIKYYINGELLKTRKFPGNIHSTTDNGFYNSALGVGRLLNHRFFNGKIDDVRIYNIELSSNNILDIYKEVLE